MVCEGVPPGTPFVDTLRNFNPAGWTHLNGRKYLCESCVSDAANSLGLFDEATAPFQASAAELADKVAQLQSDVDSYAAIQGAIDQLTNRPVIQVETTVADVVQTAKAKRTARAEAAQIAQDAVTAQEDAAAAGALLQIQLDQEAADARQASVDALANAPVVPEPDLGAATTPAADPPLEPVTPVGQAPVPGQIWNGSQWVAPPVASVVDLTATTTAPVADTPAPTDTKATA